MWSSVTSQAVDGAAVSTHRMVQGYNWDNMIDERYSYASQERSDSLASMASVGLRQQDSGSIANQQRHTAPHPPAQLTDGLPSGYGSRRASGYVPPHLRSDERMERGAGPPPMRQDDTWHRHVTLNQAPCGAPHDPAIWPCDSHAHARMPPHDMRFNAAGWMPPPPQHLYAMGPAPPMVPPPPYLGFAPAHLPPPAAYQTALYDGSYASLQPPPPMHAGYAFGGAQPQIHMADPFNARAPYDSMAVSAWASMPPMYAAVSTIPTISTPQGACPRQLSAQAASGLAAAPTKPKLKKKKSDKNGALRHEMAACDDSSQPPTCGTISTIPAIPAPQDAYPQQMREQAASDIEDSTKSGEAGEQKCKEHSNSKTRQKVVDAGANLPSICVDKTAVPAVSEPPDAHPLQHYAQGHSELAGATIDACAGAGHDATHDTTLQGLTTILSPMAPQHMGRTFAAPVHPGMQAYGYALHGGRACTENPPWGGFAAQMDLMPPKFNGDPTIDTNIDTLGYHKYKDNYMSPEVEHNMGLSMLGRRELEACAVDKFDRGVPWHEQFG